jgi:histidyl-tRNA synthetase
MITKVKGTQDMLDLRLFNYCVDTTKAHLATHHFTEIATPIIEQTELFRRSLGVDTDVVSKEMFILASQDPEESLCLRPEATAPIMRAFLENHIQHTPWKVFTYGPMFRYERPQKGRYRQFHQLSVEVIGSSAINQDVQLITFFERLFHEKFKLNNFVLHLNFLGCPKDRVRYRDDLKTFLLSPQAGGICGTCQVRREKNIMRVFDCKCETCQAIYTQAPKLTEYLCETCANEWAELQDGLDLLAVSYVLNPRLVRGLDYYNKTVFEFTSTNLGAQSAFCAGGRYDQLAQQLDSKDDFPSIGAAIGLERLMMLLEPMQESLPMQQVAPLHFILPMAPEYQQLALLLADELIAENLCTEVLFEGSLKSMMRKANHFGARYALLLGENERVGAFITVKNMVTGDEQHVPQADIVKFLKG